MYNVVETAFFLDSHESPGLQMADPGGRTPGKWHGVKVLGADAAVEARLRTVWPNP